MYYNPFVHIAIDSPTHPDLGTEICQLLKLNGQIKALYYHYLWLCSCHVRQGKIQYIQLLQDIRLIEALGSIM